MLQVFFTTNIYFVRIINLFEQSIKHCIIKLKWDYNLVLNCTFNMIIRIV